MSSRNTASRLGGALIARKGEAVPTVPPEANSEAALAKPPTIEQTGAMPNQAQGLPRGLAGTIAVTVRLNPERYERLKIYGAKSRRTNQDILVEALDALFSAKP